mgnify:CR=1 FL=1
MPQPDPTFGALEAIGSPKEVADGETITLVTDFTNQLVSGVTVSSATVKTYEETDRDADVSSTISSAAASAASPSVTQVLTAFTRGRVYRVEILATLSNSDKRLTFTRIRCRL